MKAHKSKVYGQPHEAWKTWHKALEATFKNEDEVAQKLMNELFSDEIEFKPPTYFKTRKGKPFTMMALKGVSQLFKEFEYTREFIGDRDMALEFTAKCGENGPVIHGIDMIKLDDNGKIIEFAVLARPPRAVSALLEHQSKFMAEFLKQSKM